MTQNRYTNNSRALIAVMIFMFLSHVLFAQESPYYTISKNDKGKVIATEASTGKVVFNGTNVAKVINKAIQSIPDKQGGEIRIRAGEYELTESIIIDRHGITISGDGRKSGCYGGPPYMKSDKDIDMLVIRKDGERLRGLTIRDISFYGSGTSNGKSGIHAIGCSDFLVISNVGVYNTETGIYLQGGAEGAVDAAQLQFIDPQQCGRGLVLEYCHYTKVFGGDFSDNTSTSLPEHLQTGIYLTSNTFGVTIGTKIVGSTAVRNNGSGILIGKGSYDISVQAGCDLGGNGNSGLLITNEGASLGEDMPESININGLISYNNKNAGIQVINANHVLISSCIASVNRHPHVGNRGQKYGVLISEGAKHVLVNGNMLYDNDIESIKDDSGHALITN